MPDIAGLLAAIKGQKATVGNPAAQAAAGNMATSMQNQAASAPPQVQASLGGQADPNLISAINKIKQAHGIPVNAPSVLQPQEGTQMPMAPQQAGVNLSPYSPSHVKNAIEFGIQQGHDPVDILKHIHTLLSHK